MRIDFLNRLKQKKYKMILVLNLFHFSEIRSWKETESDSIFAILFLLHVRKIFRPDILCISLLYKNM